MLNGVVWIEVWCVRVLSKVERGCVRGYIGKECFYFVEIGILCVIYKKMCVVEFVVGDEIRWRLWCGDGVWLDVGEWNVVYVKGSLR